MFNSASRRLWLCVALLVAATSSGCARRLADAPAPTPTPLPTPSALPTAAQGAVPLADPLKGTVRTSGVYGLESDVGIAFRWTNGHAVIEGPRADKPPGALHLSLVAAKPTRITVAVDGRRVAQRALPAGATDLNVALAGVSATPRLVLDSPTFRPASDTRTLGVQVRALQYARSLPPVDFVLDSDSRAKLDGFYAVETSALGFRFRWTKGTASVGMPPTATGPLVLKLRTEKPETVVRLRLDDADLGTITLVNGTVAEKRIDFRRGAHRLTIEAPVWTPPAVNGSTRPLGVEVLGLSRAAAS